MSPSWSRRSSWIATVFVTGSVLSAPFARAAELLLPFGGEFTVNSDPSVSHPAIAMTADGRFTVLWSGHRNVPGSEEYESSIDGRRFSALAEPTGSEFRLYETVDGHGGAPAVAYLADGSSLAAWVGFPDSEVSVSQVYARTFDPTGEPLGADFVVNTSTGRICGRPTITAASDVSFVVVWQSGYDAGSPQQSDEGFDLFGRLVSARGERLGAEFGVNATTYGDQGAPAIASLPQGGFVTAWFSVDPDYYDWLLSILGQRFDATGAKVGTEFLIGDPDVGKRHLPAISSAPDGGFVVAWGAGDYDAEFSNPGARDVLVRRFGKDGSALGEAFRAHADSEGRQVTPAVAHTGSDAFVVVWEDGDGHEPPGAEDVPSRDGDSFGLFGKLFDDQGSPATAEFQVNTYTVGNQWFDGPTSRTIAADEEGNVVVVWASKSDRIVGRRYCHYASVAAACGDADCLGAQITATDALVLLQNAVGSRECARCVCDVDSNGTIAATDALRVLQKAVGIGSALQCPPTCETTTTTVRSDCFEDVDCEGDPRGPHCCAYNCAECDRGEDCPVGYSCGGCRCIPTP